MRRIYFGDGRPWTLLVRNNPRRGRRRASCNEPSYANSKIRLLLYLTRLLASKLPVATRGRQLQALRTAARTFAEKRVVSSVVGNHNRPHGGSARSSLAGVPTFQAANSSPWRFIVGRSPLGLLNSSALTRVERLIS